MGCRSCRAFGFLAGLILVAALGGCALFAPRRARLPESFLKSPQAARLADPATRAEAYAALFPPLTTVLVQGSLTASNRLLGGKQHFQFSLLEFAPRELRLRGTVLQLSDPLFDLVVRDDFMTALIYQTGEYFQGAIPPEGSPFRRQYGVEPWDFEPILAIGQQVGAGKFEATRGRATTVLRPTGAASDGLQSIELSNENGLPWKAHWQIGADAWEVDYLEWNEFGDKTGDAQPRLMPARLEIRRAKPRVTITLALKSYKFQGEWDRERVLNPVVNSRMRRRPLSDLTKVLEGS